MPASGTGAAGTIQCVDALAPGAVVLGAPTVPAGAQPGYVVATNADITMDPVAEALSANAVVVGDPGTLKVRRAGIYGLCSSND